MAKTLIICEKPSVAADVAKALGAKKVSDGFYESDADVVGFAVGHLVEQVDPEAYDAKYKTWRYEDLPILPDEFRYEARDARSKKQLSLLHKAIRRKDVDVIVNACDAGREGELIFKLIYETSQSRQAGAPRVVLVDDAARPSRRRSPTCATTPRCGRSRTPPGPAPRPTGWSA